VLLYVGEIREGPFSGRKLEYQKRLTDIKTYVKEDFKVDLPDNELYDCLAAFSYVKFIDCGTNPIQSWNEAVEEWKTCQKWSLFSQQARSHLLCGCLLPRFTKSFTKAKHSKEESKGVRDCIKDSILGACELVGPFWLSQLNKIRKFEFKEWLEFSDDHGGQYGMNTTTDGQMIISANYDPVLLRKVLEAFLDRPRLEPGSTVLLLETDEFLATANAEDLANLLGKVTVPSESSISDEKINHILDFYCKCVAIVREEDENMKRWKEYFRSVEIQDVKHSGMLLGYVIDGNMDLLENTEYSETLHNARRNFQEDSKGTEKDKVTKLLRPLDAFLWLFHVRNENDYFKELNEFPIWNSFLKEANTYDLHGFSSPLTILSATAIWNMRSSDLKIITGQGKHQQKGKDRAIVYQTLVGKHGVLHGIAKNCEVDKQCKVNKQYKETKQLYNRNAGCWKIKDKDKATATTKLEERIQQVFDARKTMKNKK
jgi:hypothetical protein